MGRWLNGLGLVLVRSLQTVAVLIVLLAGLLVAGAIWLLLLHAAGAAYRGVAVHGATLAAVVGEIHRHAAGDAYAEAKDLLELGSYAAAIVGFIVVVVGALVAGYQLREAARVRRAQLYIDIRNRWIAPDLKEARQLVNGLVAGRTHAAGVTTYDANVADGFHLLGELARLKTQKPDEFAKIILILVIFEDIGLACRKRLAITQDVFDLMGSGIVLFTERFLPYMISRRPETTSSIYANALWLYRRAGRRRKFQRPDSGLTYRGKPIRSQL